MKLLNTFRLPNVGCGYLYFYIHLVTEIACFYFLSKVTNNSNIIWLIPLVYDGMAFVPQAVIGKISDKYRKIKFSMIGSILILFSFWCMFWLNINVYISLILLCLGNACIHVNGAEVTLRSSNGKLSHSAIFVSGGSFGVIIGRVLADSFVPTILIFLLIFTMIPFILLADTYSSEENDVLLFDYTNNKIKPEIIILLAVFVVIVRGYMGYGIPTSWNKTAFQSVILYFTMGIGKAFGGILSDTYGIRKTAFFSTVLAIPFLCFGDKLMLISLIGVMFFSMTMSITLAILVSVLKSSPGLAFGLTTIGLFLGTLPIFFISIVDVMINIGLIVTLSLICTVILMMLLKKDGDEYGSDI